MRLGIKQTMATKHVILLFLLARKYITSIVKSVLLTSTLLSTQTGALIGAFLVTNVPPDWDCILHVEHSLQKNPKYFAKNALQAGFLPSLTRPLVKTVNSVPLMR